MKREYRYHESCACFIDTQATSAGIVGHVRFQVAGPVGLFERAIAIKISDNEGGSPASGGNEAAPRLLYVPCRSGHPSGVGTDFIEAHPGGYGGLPERVAHPSWASANPSPMVTRATLNVEKPNVASAVTGAQPILVPRNERSEWHKKLRIAGHPLQRLVRRPCPPRTMLLHLPYPKIFDDTRETGNGSIGICISRITVVDIHFR